MGCPLLRGGFHVGNLRVVMRVSSFGTNVVMLAGGVGSGCERGEDGVCGRDVVVVTL
jgi:hypothetical protein